jgi:glycosyltransferase 2 family protein
VNARRASRGILMVTSIGLALHLVLPEIPGHERSLRLILGTSHLLVGAAFVAEVLSELCYAELLGRSVGTVSGLGFSSRVRRHRGIERWFLLRLLVLLGVGSEAAIPILGYRLFNFWLPIPLAVIFYPTLRFGAGRKAP